MLGLTLQEFELVPVTDPVEFAALDRRWAWIAGLVSLQCAPPLRDLSGRGAMGSGCAPR
jgi:hypothetical protein